MSVYKDKKNGTWYCKCYYKDWRGIRKQKWKRGFSTKKEAQMFERNFLQRRESSADITFGNLYHVYLEEMSTRLKYSTIIIKRNICETKILPYFENKKVDEITAVDIRQWQNLLMSSEKKYSETYLKTINNQLTAIINYAKKYYNLAKSPCEQAGSIGMSKADKMQYWTLEEYLTFREKVKKKAAAYLCFEMLYWTGIRCGELLALTLEDIDLESREIWICKTYQRINGRDVITEPKTKKSTRKVLMPEFLCNEIQSYIDSFQFDKTEKRVFPFTRFFLNYEMKRGCRETGIKKIRLHDLRHSHVSLLINQGFDALVIADRVGHENVSTTLNTYAHLFPNRQTALVDSLEELERKNRDIKKQNGSSRVAEKKGKGILSTDQG